MTQKTLNHYVDTFNPSVKVGDQVMLISKYDENSGSETWHIRVTQDGISGNMDATQKRFHGWRGTTNIISITAHGLRQVIKVVNNGDSQRVTVGKDLHPDWA